MQGRGHGPAGGKIRVRTARGRRPGSTRWLQRQLNDPYVARARAEGYRARSAYKLIEIDERHCFLKPGARVVDLGAAPGGWAQVAAARVRSGDAAPLVVALDLTPIDPLPGVAVLTIDFLDPAAPDAIRAALGGHAADVVLSDMAAPTIGHPRTDHLRIMHLVEAAAAFAREVLAPGGAFLAKVFRGGTETALLAELKREFASVAHVKPKASRAESTESYVLAKGFRGGSPESRS
jgi:23S rRNA (uridine2552-2'-O)-methyltransferase